MPDLTVWALFANGYGNDRGMQEIYATPQAGLKAHPEINFKADVPGGNYTAPGDGREVLEWTLERWQVHA